MIPATAAQDVYLRRHGASDHRNTRKRLQQEDCPQPRVGVSIDAAVFNTCWQWVDHISAEKHHG